MEQALIETHNLLLHPTHACALAGERDVRPNGGNQ